MNWTLNLFLYFAFVRGQWTGDFSIYQQMVDLGATCYVETPWSDHTQPRPACFYNPDAK